ncbi:MULTISPECIES: chemotaxis protein CheD [unclassified Undibacterium]|uniref:chemotaxis protein CheD n=1 Tax=unclassified Undibacterium TaxID=2630295 RepID=UPI002AC9E36B|nr:MULTISPECIES: chemotaxis protein CheD [unclassified Undibacterium]MEB0140735.1 chemotaxis protein CheD [Undibacterium sp. CCC2.1]MEB0174094.1 chemotaxis protein CheD [Undibacterium sp. CCC1.1]MEB0178079.1 chemotaxis protein CheD [Undibacterium sp. CCC3.4]MEB0216949.1 chemotaxis protein CheD [Undibacterium sp. 5I2]WPX44532.1 chemotaxis protein CheD [Undibacterium sp. CCC3.4]
MADSRMPAPPFYIDIFLQPGDFYFGDSDTRIRTILGSCVAITIWHPILRIGGMCHYMLPKTAQRQQHHPLDGRYAEDAVQMFLKEIKKSHTHPRDFEIKMFGGGNQFPQQNSGLFPISDRNIELGSSLLAQHGLQLKSQHLGGVGHRNVMFDLWSGDVWVKHVEKVSTP